MLKHYGKERMIPIIKELFSLKCVLLANNLPEVCGQVYDKALWKRENDPDYERGFFH